MFPDSAQRISSSVGSGFSCRSATEVSIIPGVQKPHWRPCSSRNATWIGCSSAPCCRPSTVVISRPSAWTASTVQDLTGTPSSRTVQAPQWVVSHPWCVPVRPSVCRRKWTSSSRGSTSAACDSPLTVTLTARVVCAAVGSIAVSAIAPPFRRGSESALDEYPCDAALVLGAPANVVLRLGRLRGKSRRLDDRLVVELTPGERLLGRRRLEVGGPDARERDPGASDRAVVERDVDRGPDGGVVADLALELEIRPRGRRARIAHLQAGDHLVLLERGRERALEELLDRNRPRSRRGAGFDVGPDREHDRAPVGLRVGVCERAANRAEVAHDRVGDLRGCRAESAEPAAEQLRALARLVTDERAHAETAVLLCEGVQTGNRVDVDKRPWGRESELHQWDQTLAPGEDLRLAVESVEELTDFLEGRWSEVLEPGGIHEVTSLAARDGLDRSAATIRPDLKRLHVLLHASGIGSNAARPAAKASLATPTKSACGLCPYARSPDPPAPGAGRRGSSEDDLPPTTA